MIDPALVELAIYAAWYPIPQAVADGTPFPCELTVKIPAEYTIASRGQRIDSRVVRGQRQEVWAANVPGRDIPLFASNNIRQASIERDRATVAVLYRELPTTEAENLLSSAADSLSYLSTLFGTPHASPLQIVFSPRSGWGYSRTGYIAMSEERAIRQLADDNPESGPRDAMLHNQVHEIGHFWWSLADTTTGDDWLNESLAEYSAAKDSERRDPTLRLEWDESISVFSSRKAADGKHIEYDERESTPLCQLV